MTTYRFQQITRSREIRLKCSGCGKMRTRRIAVMNTINPYNRNEDGSVRTPQEVLACVVAQLAKDADAIAIKGITCKVCLAKSELD